MSNYSDNTFTRSNPPVLQDPSRWRHTSEVIDLLEKTNWDCYSTPASRGLCLDETLENFKGVFCNEKSPKGVFESIKKHDLVLHFGSKINETSFRYSGKNEEINNWLATQDICFLGRDFAMIGFKKELIKNISGCKVFNRFLEVLDYSKIQKIIKSKAEQSRGQLYSDSYKLREMVMQEDRLFEQEVSYELSKNILQKGDILLCEMSSFAFELENIKLPSGGRIICQSFYASIGYALPATVGVCKALKDYNMNNRVLLLQGDGSAQMTLQELSLFLKYDLNPMILMLNNSGYTIERAIIGATSSYNDLTAKWDWQKMLEAFGDSNKDKHETFRIGNYDELKTYISEKGTKPLDKLHMVELILDKFDYGNGLLVFLGKKSADEAM
ncbi:Pyruvate decarboxylase isozyme 1 [Hanseniaspora opuntiae]|uniref:Pyruvate decarboxylase isozyme 1 n=1 Tax=Hanseniaspora opuntiae TaxID=211096 RepID=A0A1E5R5Y5_9ASCO|nr:Pyruvate decarboxylase isozyme 1 [Hanseniaspora opuntiae]